MTNFLSFPDNFKEDDFDLLKPVEWGKFYRYETPVYVIRFMGPEPVPIERDSQDPLTWAKEDELWKSHHQRRMNVECPLEILDRFSIEAFDNGLIKKVSGFTFEDLAQWINAQTSGRWSALIYADKKKRPRHSYIVLSFERAEDAVFFKLFNMDE